MPVLQSDATLVPNLGWGLSISPRLVCSHTTLSRPPSAQSPLHALSAPVPLATPSARVSPVPGLIPTHLYAQSPAQGPARAGAQRGSRMNGQTREPQRPWEAWVSESDGAAWQEGPWHPH